MQAAKRANGKEKARLQPLDAPRSQSMLHIESTKDFPAGSWTISLIEITLRQPELGNLVHVLG